MCNSKVIKLLLKPFARRGSLPVCEYARLIRRDCVRPCHAFSELCQRMETLHCIMLPVQDVDGRTVLHHAVTVAGNYAIIRLLLNSLTESERVQAVNMTDNDGSTVLQLTKSSSTRNFIVKLVMQAVALFFVT